LVSFGLLAGAGFQENFLCTAELTSWERIVNIGTYSREKQTKEHIENVTLGG